MKTHIIYPAILALSMASCGDETEKRREKEIEQLKAFDRQHDKAMEDASQGEFPEPKPARPIPE